MAVKKIDDVNRAAQFLPFDALKGLSEEIQSRIEKRSRVERKELSEERKEEISAVLCKRHDCNGSILFCRSLL